MKESNLLTTGFWPLIDYVHLSTQDWWDSVKNELEKPSFDKKHMGDMYCEMHSSLGDPSTDGHGMFRRRFIQVCSLFWLAN